MPGLNYNYNYNYNYSAGGGGGGGRQLRERFNTDYYTRLGVLYSPAPPVSPNFLVPNWTFPLSGPPFTQYPPYETNWDADLRAYMSLDKFKTAIDVSAGVGNSWVTQYQNYITGPVATGGAGLTPPHLMTQTNMDLQIRRMLDLSLEREPRFCEVIDQDGGDGAINYLVGMLHIYPARHPRTRRMVGVGRRIGEFVVMNLKGTYMSPRPSQLAPALTPMFDAPATPAFPAGHALQAYLISYLVAYSLPNLPGHVRPATPVYPNPTGGAATLATGLLFDLAGRISENRIVAGIHYPEDIEAGLAVAVRCFNDIRSLIPAEWTALSQGVQAEFPQYV